MRHGSHFFQRNASLSPLQKEQRQKEFEREQEGKQAGEQLEVCCDFHPLRRNTILTPSKKEARRREHGRKEKETLELEQRLKVHTIPTSSDKTRLKWLRRGQERLPWRRQSLPNKPLGGAPWSCSNSVTSTGLHSSFTTSSVTCSTANRIRNPCQILIQMNRCYSLTISTRCVALHPSRTLLNPA